MQHNWKTTAGWVMLSVLLCGAGIGLYRGISIWIHTSPLFYIRHVEVLGNYLVSDEHILTLARIPDSIRIFDVDRDSVTARVERHQFIDRVRVHRRLPATLVLSVRERRPVAILAGSPVSLLDATGDILPEAPHPAVLDLPLVSGLTSKQGSFSQPENAEKLAWALSILQHLQHDQVDLYHRVSEIYMGADRTVTLYLTDGATPVYLHCGDSIFDKLYQLAQFLRYRIAAGEERTVEYINLQYDNQIIVKYTQRG